MKSMKKIISLILTLLMLLTFVPTSFASYTDTDDKDILLISALGLMEGYDDGTFLPDNNITRAEFAQIIANIYAVETDNTEEWENLYFRDQDEEAGLITEYGAEVEAKFLDVDSAHWAYNAVNTVYNLGYMDGVSKNEFAPDDYLTAPQIYKILSVMMGYRVKAVIKGGYPRGYIAVANEIGLSDGISNLSELSRAEVAKILVNAFDIEMMYLSSVGDKENYETYEDKTFLTEIMGLNKISGRMTDNGVTTLSAASSSFMDNVVVGDRIVRITEDTEYLRAFIGRNIDLYYETDKESGINFAVYGVLNGKDNVVTFDADDFAGTDINSISYKSGETIKKLNLKNGTPLIKNGLSIENPQLSDFEVNKGTYTVVQSSSSNVYDLILLDSYVSFYVDAVDSVNKKAYSLSSLVADRILDFSDQEKIYIVYDEKGGVTDFEGISNGSVLSVSDSDRMMKVYISKTIVANAVISEMYTDNKDIIVVSGNKKYILSKDFIQLKGDDVVQVGKAYNLYLDKFGDIINVGYTADNTLSTGFIIDLKNFGTFDPDYQIKYVSESGVITTSSLASKVTVIEGSSEVLMSDLDDLADKLEGYDDLFRYRLNADKQMELIELATNQNPAGDNPNNRLLRIKLDRDPITDLSRPYSYVSDPYTPGYGRTIEGLAFGDTNGNTKVFVCPSDYSYEESFRVVNMSSSVFPDGRATGKTIRAYTLEGDTPYANYIISKSAATSSDFLDPRDKTAAIVKSVVKGLDQKGEPANVITVYPNGTATETKLYCTDAVLNDVRDIWGRKHSDYDAANGVWGTDVEKYKIEMGDVIRYVQNPDGSLSKIYLLFDENGTNPASGGQGTLAGSYGYYDASKTSLSEGLAVTGTNAYMVNANPYCIREGQGDYIDIDDDTGAVPSKSVSSTQFINAMTWSVTEFKAIFGYPVIATPKTLTLTTLDLSVNDYDYYTLDTAKYARETYRPSSVVLYVIEGSKLYPVSISLTDLKTYNLAGNDCDRIFGVIRNGTPSFLIPIRGKTTN